MSDIRVNDIYPDYNPDGDHAFLADKRGRLFQYKKARNSDYKRINSYRKIKSLLPTVRSKERKGTGLARFIVKQYLSNETFYPRLTDKLPDHQALSVWKNAFKLLAVRHNETRAVVDDFVKRGGLDEQAFGQKDFNRDAMSVPPWVADRVRFSESKQEDSPFPYYHNIYAMRDIPGIRFEYENRFREDKPPIGVLGGTVAPLLVQTIRTIANSIVEKFINENEIHIDATDGFPELQLQIAVWKDAFFRLGRQVLYDRIRIDDIMSSTTVMYAPGERLL
jgi:hypothetical protein